ncbi:MAG: tRNA (adenine(22)-N(1))-methyltransferase [Candidatus Izemoplasmataceae bacterium]
MLNHRLSTCLPYLKGCTVLYDIGTDHAYFPIYAIKEGLIKKAYAIDNKIGPLSLAKDNIEKHGLSDKIYPILASGIDAMKPEVDIIMMAGLGGNLIYDIFKSANLPYVKRLILQPNNNASSVRRLIKNNYVITDEQIIIENGTIYTIIILEPGHKDYTEKEILFGPVLLKTKPALYKQQLENELSHINSIIKQVPKGKLNPNLLKEALLIKEVLDEWSTN